MTENRFQQELEELLQRIRSLKPHSVEDAGRARALLPGALAGLQRSLAEATAIVGELPENPGAGSNTSEGNNGTPSKQARRPSLAPPVWDTAEREEAHQERSYRRRLRALMADFLLAEEHERRRLAIDLHDGLSQTVALTQIKLSALRVSLHGEQKEPLDEIEELIDQTNRAARAISFELSPPILHDLGLEPAVQWLVENIQIRYGIEIVLEDDGRPKVADEITRIILFRSIRELLINAAKHAGSRHVHVSLRREKDHLDAWVEDDGVGMDSEVALVRGFGLSSIHERLRHVGGSMRIESAPGQGTSIRLSAPLTNGKKTKAGV